MRVTVAGVLGGVAVARAVGVGGVGEVVVMRVVWDVMGHGEGMGEWVEVAGGVGEWVEVAGGEGGLEVVGRGRCGRVGWGCIRGWGVAALCSVGGWRLLGGAQRLGERELTAGCGKGRAVLELLLGRGEHRVKLGAEVGWGVLVRAKRVGAM